ncbi:ABC transporter substrate-binding protein [Acaricomes phytoseiuli]|uniref:ABC transporter substrate-binding protein n=1 Tax=Acaricomes phytoseiuli TaxID=291968 RepID=UPI00039B3A61|nr:ABC transporter substrate-binding protein [Acaricomes phytoseiuli]
MRLNRRPMRISDLTPEENMQPMSSRGQLSRRALLGGIGASLALSGCSAIAPKESYQQDQATGPATISHLYGTTTIDYIPQKVVTIGLASPSICVDLGVTPIAFGAIPGAPTGVMPWFYEKFGKIKSPISGFFPEVFGTAEGIPFERLGEIAPDLIIAVNSNVTQDDYERLSAIAPTAGPLAPNGTTHWRDSTRAIATLLRREDRAQEILSETEKAFQQARENYPSEPERSFLYITTDTTVGSPYQVHAIESNAVKIIEEFGFRGQGLPSGFDPVLTKPPMGPPQAVLLPGEATKTLPADFVAVELIERSPDRLRTANINTENLRNLPGYDQGAQAILDWRNEALALIDASPLGIRTVAEGLAAKLSRAAYLSSV